MTLRVLVACEYSGRVRDAFRRAVLGEEYESRIAPLQIADKARGD